MGLIRDVVFDHRGYSKKLAMSVCHLSDSSEIALSYDRERLILRITTHEEPRKEGNGQLLFCPLR
jgi:hypothetical protein